jgi:hypothetical protein
MDDEDDEAVEIMKEAIIQRRKATEQYIELLNHFGPALKGTVNWTKNKTIKTARELLTISDEAFIAICIINYGDRWKKEWKIRQGEEDEEEMIVSKKMCCDCALFEKCEILTMIHQLPKFTVPRKGKRSCDEGKLHSLNGWSNEGLEMFNKIAKAVMLDRNKRGEEFDQEFKEKMEEEDMNKMRRKKKKRAIQIVTYNDLNGAAELHSKEEHSEEEEEVSISVFEA